MKHITKHIPEYNLEKFLDVDLEEIYMYCAVNCIENPYIANYIKTRKQIEDEENTNEREQTSQYTPIISYDESGNEEEPPIQPISLIRSSKKRIEPTHDVVKKKKRKRKRGKKISLPNNVAPIIVVPHENESKIIVEDDALDDDLVMPIACCDDYDWEDNDTSYDLENLFGTCLEEYDNCYTIGAIHTINDESDYAYDMKRPKLGDAMFDEDDIFSLPSFDMQIYNDDSMPPTYDDYIDESGFGRVSTLGSSDPSILDYVVSYNIYESGFGEVMTLFSNDSTILEEVSIDYDENKVATYDDYCDKTYAIKSSDDYIYKSCHDYDYPFSEHYSFNVETIFSFQVFYDTPTIPNEKNFAYVESSKISMQVDHEKNALGAGYC